MNQKKLLNRKRKNIPEQKTGCSITKKRKKIFSKEILCNGKVVPAKRFKYRFY